MTQRGGRQVHAHHFHHHLAGVCRAVESAQVPGCGATHSAWCSKAVSDLAWRKAGGCGFVADTAGYRACGDEDTRICMKDNAPIIKPGNDFVALMPMSGCCQTFDETDRQQYFMAITSRRTWQSMFKIALGNTVTLRRE